MTSEDTMRTLVVGVSLALIALAMCPAIQRGPGPLRIVQLHYFGYVSNGPGVCSPVTSCFTEGRRCKASCVPQANND